MEWFGVWIKLDWFGKVSIGLDRVTEVSFCLERFLLNLFVTDEKLQKMGCYSYCKHEY